MKNKTGGLILSDFKTNHKSLLISTAYHWGKGRYTNGTEWRSHKQALTGTVSGKRSVFSINSARKTGYPQAKNEVGCLQVNATHKT